MPGIHRHRAADPWKIPFSTSDLIQQISKGLEIPKVWTAAEFAIHGRALIVTLERLAQLTQRKAIPYVAKKANQVFERQLQSVITRATRRAIGTRKLPEPSLPDGPHFVEILVPQHESIWLEAIDEVMKESGLEVALEIVPPVQSVMAQAYSRTGALLSIEADPDNSQAIARESREIAQKITRVNETTRKEFERHVREAIQQGSTVVELANRLEQELLPMQKRRSMTIARTELNRAFTIGSATALKESPTLTHVSVIGCTAREPGQYEYNGQPTCNYPDLPVVEIDAFLAVGFHPNHGGSLVPSAMRDP